MTLHSKKLEKQIQDIGYCIKDIGLGGRDPKYFGKCNWWRLTYKFLDYSIYYDPEDILGRVGVPYYEFYDNEETYRYIDNLPKLLTRLKRNKIEHDKETKEYPERFL